jgi:hypothetical protein
VRTKLLLAAAVAALAAAVAAPAPAAPLSARGARILARTTWWGGAYRAGGTTVTVYVSASYASDPGTAARWAAFFGSLVHGAELQSLVAYVVSPSELAQVCGARALGCYGARGVVFPGEPVDGVAPRRLRRTSTDTTSRRTG